MQLAMVTEIGRSHWEPLSDAGALVAESSSLFVIRVKIGLTGHFSSRSVPFAHQCPTDHD